MDKEVRKTIEEIVDGNLSGSRGLLQMAIRQGYVPSSCTLNGKLVMALINSGEDPYKGCNMDRTKCGGRPKR